LLKSQNRYFMDTFVPATGAFQCIKKGQPESVTPFYWCRSCDFQVRKHRWFVASGQLLLPSFDPGLPIIAEDLTLEFRMADSVARALVRADDDTGIQLVL